MRSPGLKFGYLMELILTFAAAFALLYWTRIGYRHYGIKNLTIDDILRVYVNPLLFAVGLVGGLGAVVEGVRSRSPQMPGLGRWTWMVAAVYIAAMMGWYTMFDGFMRLQFPTAYQDERLSPEGLRNLCRTWNYGQGLPPALIGILILRRIYRIPKDDSPDLREWLGRILWVALIIVWLIQQPFRYLRW